ncbi:MAG: CBS domain-containing protein [Methanobrevibacter sp.]|jgi:CBS domain-containing protein|uniref:CBS domain-containing protein n=1 Tax=Methanobrevibacter millerae TaxID=230361 RepID=A0A8T3VJM8_9EURY|nr:CBS domain-containing protein [Methanobrevibacter millerae]MBE6505483.1 CBS domain-containing protein [Methanobrevibacter millerae]MBR0058088.1 CBS domain-containing protein [Methanobrevibacter sp.]MBR0370042.1 CBS domain-containing protein [Methanobrevibacter sp.]
MQIKNLMSTSLITIDKDQSLSDALKLLRKNKISRLPVLNNKELVGIVSERDIAKKLGSSKYESMPASRLHVSSVMVKDIISVPQSMRLAEVANIMLENGIGSVPVMEDDKMVGIVSKADFITLAIDGEYEKICTKEIMTKDVISVSPSERLVHARRVSIDNKVGRLPVMDDEELVGMITSKDLMRAFIDFRKNVPEKYQKSQIKEVLIEYIMSTNPRVVSKDTPISEVSKIMMETGFNGLPVVENDKVIGIITQTDILRLISKLEA